jgi:hypothetical protein
LIDTAAALHQRQGCDLVVFDSLAYLLPPHTENSASAMYACVTPLHRLTKAGMSVLLPYHPSKGKTIAGQAARGSGALPSFVNVMIEMGFYAQPDDLDRRRRLVSFSRHEDTPQHLLVELNAEGTDYAVLQSGLVATLGDNWLAVLQVLREAHSKLTRQEILDNWSADYSKPDSTTLWRWLSRAVAQGIVRQEGKGHHSDPFRYWLPAREAFMRPEGGSAEEMQAWNALCLAEIFGEQEPASGAETPQEMPLLGKQGSTGAPAVAAVQAERTPTESVPPPGTGPQTAVSSSATPDPLPSPLAQPIAEQAPVRLPYPFNIMNPAEVPEEVWKRARAAQQNSL